MVYDKSVGEPWPGGLCSLISTEPEADGTLSWSAVLGLLAGDAIRPIRHSPFKKF